MLQHSGSSVDWLAGFVGFVLSNANVRKTVSRSQVLHGLGSFDEVIVETKSVFASNGCSSISTDLDAFRHGLPLLIEYFTGHVFT